MRQGVVRLVWVGVAMTALGCASNHASKTESSTSPQPAEGTSGKTCTVQSGGRDLLCFTVAPNTGCTSKEGRLQLKSPDNDFVHVWLVQGAKTVDEAVGRVDQVISSEFTKFKAATTTSVTIAGAPAKRIAGTGVEADDGDPGSADVVVFKAGDHVFIACVHAERLSSATQQWMMTVVQTAHAP